MKQPDSSIVNQEIITFGSEGDNAWSPEQLHVKFEVEQVFLATYWSANITIYNLNAPTQQNMILFGMVVRLYAGYQSDQQPGLIFEGMVFQPMWETEGGVNAKLTLRCLVGLQTFQQVAYTTTPAGNNVRTLVANMAKSCKLPLTVDIGDDVFADSDPPTRATVFFGQPNELISSLATTFGASSWMTNQNAQIQMWKTSDTVPELEYNSTNGLIGTAQMVQDGVQIKVLLDSRAQVLKQIKLPSNVVIRQQQWSPNPDTYPTFLSAGGEYTIAKIRHVGDTRGNEWYTEITAMVHNSQARLMMGWQ
jgi:hypothetical protein